MKQTSVEWLFNQLSINNITFDKGTKAHQEMEQKILEKAKEMHKEQMKKFYGKLQVDENNLIMDFENYYNQIFKLEEQ